MLILVFIVAVLVVIIIIIDVVVGDIVALPWLAVAIVDVCLATSSAPAHALLPPVSCTCNMQQRRVKSVCCPRGVRVA